MSGVTPSVEFNRQLVATVRKVLRSMGQEFGETKNSVRLSDNPTVMLSEELAGASDPLDDDNLPIASADFLRASDAGGWVVETDRTIRLYNRSRVTQPAGTIGTWRMSLGKACFIADASGDSGGQASGNCCCCVTLDTPNTELTTGEWTTTRRIPCGQIGDVRDDTQPNLNITIRFPPPSSVVLLKESDSDNYVWTFDESTVTVEATYLDGSPAAVASLDGVAMFAPHNNGRTELVISWTAVIPDQIVFEDLGI